MDVPLKLALDDPQAEYDGCRSTFESLPAVLGVRGHGVIGGRGFVDPTPSGVLSASEDGAGDGEDELAALITTTRRPKKTRRVVNIKDATAR